MSLRLAQVGHVYPQHRTCEVTMLDNGQRFQNVMYCCHYSSSNSGVWMAHGLLRPDSEEIAGALRDPIETDMPLRSTTAVVAMINGRPFVMGFMSHPYSQLAFIHDEQNRDIYRAPAGVIATVQRDGNFELHHTGGAFFKIGKDIETTDADRHEDLTPLCWNENWIYPLNDPVTITLVTGDQGDQAFKGRIRETGDTDLMSSGYLHIRYQRDAHVDIGETTDWHSVDEIRVSSGADIHIRTPGNVIISAGGDVTSQALGNAFVYAGGDLTAAAAGNTTVAGGAEVTVSAAELLYLGAPEIEAHCEIFTVFGELILDAPDPEGGAVGEEQGAIAAEAAAGEVEAAEADIEEAITSIEEAVLEAVETSLEAVGTGEPDNLGEGGDPAPDIPA